MVALGVGGFLLLVKPRAVACELGVVFRRQVPGAVAGGSKVGAFSAALPPKESRLQQLAVAVDGDAGPGPAVDRAAVYPAYAPVYLY